LTITSIISKGVGLSLGEVSIVNIKFVLNNIIKIKKLKHPMRILISIITLAMIITLCKIIEDSMLSPLLSVEKLPLILANLLQSFVEIYETAVSQNVNNVPLAFATAELTASDANVTEPINKNVTLGLNLTAFDPQKRKYSADVYINAAKKQTLSEIKNVIYDLGPTFTQRYFTANSSHDKFKISFSAVGQFNILANVTFNDGEILSLKKYTGDATPGYILPPELISDLKTEGLTATISGEARSVEGITQIHVDWGDGGKTENGTFPFSHTYDTGGLYNITITAYDKIGSPISKSMQTPNLFLESFFQNLPSVAIDTKSNSTLKLNDLPDFIRGERSDVLSITGILSHLNNGSGIENQQINMEIRDKSNNQTIVGMSTATDQTDEYGVFEGDLSQLELHKGTYIVSAQPVSAQPPKDSLYSKLRVTTEINALGHELTSQDLIGIVGGIVGTGVAVSGAINTLPGYFKQKKQRKNLTLYIKDIDNDYETCKNTKECLSHLGLKRNAIIESLNRGEISQEQYEILDKKISDYMENVS
jgi:hypothetical protein